MHADPRGRGVADVILSAETSASDSATVRWRRHCQRRGSARADTTGLLQRSARRGLPYSTLAPLQRVINDATRLVFGRGTTSRTPPSSCTSCQSARGFRTSCVRSLWSPYVIGQTIIFLPCGFYFSSFFFFFSSPNLIGRRLDVYLPYFHTWCGLSANLECMSEMCCTRLAVNTGRKKSPFWHHRTTLSGYIFGTKACIDNRNTSSTCPDNMVNFGLLMAEIRWRVWGTPANFTGFRVLAALLHGTLVVGVSQTLQR